jgi:hypothetical protein
MIELKVIVEDDNRAEELLLELNSQKGVSASVSPKAYEIGDEKNSSSVSEPTTPQGPSVNADLFNETTHFFDGENLYVTRRYYEDYIRDMAYNFAHPEEHKNEPLRTVSAEELADCITLDEFRNELTEMIHKHYHPQA